MKITKSGRTTTPGKESPMNKRRHLVWLLVLLPLGMVLAAGPSDGSEALRPLNMELPSPDVPQPQMFCGYCHVLTYPGVIQNAYTLWKKDKHNKAGCVECHYPPSSQAGKSAALPLDLRPGHIPAKPPERFSHLPIGGSYVQKRPRVTDANCMTSNCHGSPKDQFKTKKIKFTEKVLFVHESHLDKKKQIEGQQLNCVSCHQHETDKKKFEVSQASCHQCHFTNVVFNEERGRCEICHQLPKKPIQTSGDKPITHLMLKEAGVACASCHLDVIQGAGETKFEVFYEKGLLKTEVFLGAGKIKTDNCTACHDGTKALKEKTNKELMHKKHVTVKNARCFDCHRPVRHTLAKTQSPEERKTAVLDLKRSVQSSCAACHPEPHLYQRLLAEGARRKGVIDAPDPMFKVRTNCLACHVKETHTPKGAQSMAATAETCVKCHTKDHRKMLKDWKNELAKEIKETREVEKEAVTALQQAKAELSPARLTEARKILAEGRANLNIVLYGNGVHNKKYSILLIDAAITAFDDMIAFVEEGD
jgi:hypothetical protein